MNFKSESEFTRWFCKMVEARGAETIAFVGSKMQQSGLPDRYVAHSIFRGWIEFKRKTNDYTSLQYNFIRDMKAKCDVAMGCRITAKGVIIFEDEDQNPHHSLRALELEYLKTDKERGQMLLVNCSIAWECMVFARPI